jgi:hypothetical protein
LTDCKNLPLRRTGSEFSETGAFCRFTHAK